jgi:hypothetical protein
MWKLKKPAVAWFGGFRVWMDLSQASTFAHKLKFVFQASIAYIKDVRCSLTNSGG